MRTLSNVAVALGLLLAAGGAQAQPIDPKVQARIDRILKRTPLIDGHNDLPWALRQDHGQSVEGLESGTD
jgi:membrane dipeptidase